MFLSLHCSSKRSIHVLSCSSRLNFSLSETISWDSSFESSKTFELILARCSLSSKIILANSLCSQQQKVENEEELQSWLRYPQDWVFRQGDRFITAYPAQHKELIDYLTTCLTCISLGFGISEKKRVAMVPQHSLSMSKAYRKDAFPCIELDLDTARAYLRSDALEVSEGMPTGIVLLTYEDVPLGFVKNVGNRLNNLYPNEWRIRKL